MRTYRTHLKNVPMVVRFGWQIIAGFALWFGITFAGCYSSHNTSQSPVQTEQEQDPKTKADSKEPAISNQGISGKSESLQIELQPDSTVLCLGECIDIAVRVFGGSPPYHVSWDHELSSATTLGPHEVCPDSNTTYTVSVRDTGLDSQEFVIPPDQVQGYTTITVVDDCASSILLDAGDDATLKDASEHSYADASDVADASDDSTNDTGESTTTPPCVPNCPDLRWVTIPGGSFLMGSPEGICEPYECPQHEVTVQTFIISKTEVTVAQFGKCIEAGVCNEPSDTYSPDSFAKFFNWNAPGRENHPMNTVSWNDAKEFAEWLGARLPTEAEWEYAARSGGRDITYPWGNQEASCDYAVVWIGDPGCDANSTREVCSIPLGNTDQGLCDMAGNVWEWVEDDWHENYTGAPLDGRAWIDDPRNTRRVYRSCSFWDSHSDCGSAYRNRVDLNDAYLSSGFRVVQVLK